MAIFAILVLVTLCAFYKYYMYSLTYWERKKYPTIKGSFPLGSKPNRFFSPHYQGMVYEEFYYKLAPHSFGGFYVFRKPELLIRDPELIKLILVKDFSYFQSRFGKLYSKSDPLSMNLVSLEGDLWKNMRAKLTPAFSSGRLKGMYPLFEECCDQFCEVLDQELASNCVINVKELLLRFTTDAIAACAFGLKQNAVSDYNCYIRNITRELNPPYIRLSLKISYFLFATFPFLKGIISMKILSSDANSFFINMIKKSVEYREANNVKRNDFMNLLLELKEQDYLDNNESKMDLTMVIAQSSIFLAAGLESPSTVLSCAFYELAMNQSIQNRLRDEIKEVLESHGGKPSYHALQETPFMEQVIYETLRKYPTTPLLSRQCTKNYKSEKYGLDLEKGTGVVIPVYALHHDPKYFPDPDKFDPDRFSEANKSSFPQYAFLPFSEGPRHCIGMRLGLLLTKLGIVTILSRYRVLPAANTQIPLNFAPTMLVSTFRENVYLKVERLKN